MVRPSRVMAVLALAGGNCLALPDVVNDVRRLVKPSASLDVELGLSKATLEYLNGLPAEIRVQALKLLKDALPLIDDSVLRYLDRIDEIADRTVRNTACLAAGVMRGAIVEAGAQFPFKGDVTVFKDLRSSRDRSIARMNRWSSPEDYTTTYADLLVNASATRCYLESIKAFQAYPEAGEYTREAATKLDIWTKVKGHCKTAQECVDWVRADVKERTNNADPRDLQSVQASARFAAIVWPQIGVGYFTPQPFELAMMQARAVEHSVDLAKVVRMTRARLLMDLAQRDLKAADEAISKSFGESINAIVITSPSSHRRALGRMSSARARLNDMQVTLDNIHNELVAAKELDVQHEPIASYLSTRVQANKVRAQGIVDAVEKDIPTVTRDLGRLEAERSIDPPRDFRTVR